MVFPMFRMAPRAAALLKAPASRSLTLAAPRAAAAAPKSSVVTAVTRSLHSTRAALSETTLDAYNKQAAKYQSKVTKNMFVLEAPSVTTWQEIPRGGIYAGLTRSQIIWKIWYNHAVVPLYVTCAVAAGVCAYFLYRYFTRHVDIAWTKEMRGTYDHTGLDESRANSHDNRLLYSGMRDRNKRDVQMFPFNFVPMHKIAEKRFIDYNKEE